MSRQAQLDTGSFIAETGSRQAQTDTGLFLGEIISAAATAVTLNGPSSGAVNAASTNFNVGVDATPIAGTLVVTPATDVSSGGTFSPTTVSLTTGSPSATFTFTPSKSGVHHVSVTNDGGLTNPSSVTYTVKPEVSVTLVASPSDSTPQINLASLHWTWRDATDYNTAVVPTDRGSTGTTNSSGVFTVALPNSTKTNGQTGVLEIANAAGTTVATGIVAVT